MIDDHGSAVHRPVTRESAVTKKDGFLGEINQVIKADTLGNRRGDAQRSLIIHVNVGLQSLRRAVLGIWFSVLRLGHGNRMRRREGGVGLQGCDVAVFEPAQTSLAFSGAVDNEANLKSPG